MGRKPASSPDAERSEKKEVRHTSSLRDLWKASGRSYRAGLGAAAASSNLASQSAFHTGGKGGGRMHKSHKFMRVDVSLPPGIMRDRALAERDFVTFPEIFFFSVLSKRCRAMWEAGSLEGFEELSVLSTHSLRPFIWSKCSEKLPTVQRRRDKHIQENRGWERWGQGKREGRTNTGKHTPTWLPGPDCARQTLKTHDWFEKGEEEEEKMKEVFIQVSFVVVYKSANS